METQTFDLPEDVSATCCACICKATKVVVANRAHGDLKAVCETHVDIYGK